MEFIVKVENKDLAKALNSISAWDGKARLRVEDALKKGTRAIRSQAYQRAAKKSGALKKSIKCGFSTTKLEGRVYTNLPYAHQVEYGTRQYKIAPKKKKALKFSVDGTNVFAKKVIRPKREGKPFMKPAYDYVAPDIIKNVRRAVTKK